MTKSNVNMGREIYLIHNGRAPQSYMDSKEYGVIILLHKREKLESIIQFQWLIKYGVFGHGKDFVFNSKWDKKLW